MNDYRVCVIGGWCGNRMFMVAEHLDEVLHDAGFPSRVTTHSVWENYSRPPASDLVLQLLPAFTEEEARCPVLTIKPLLADLNQAETIGSILDRVGNDYPRITAGNLI